MRSRSVGGGLAAMVWLGCLAGMFAFPGPASVLSGSLAGSRLIGYLLE